MDIIEKINNIFKSIRNGLSKALDFIIKIKYILWVALILIVSFSLISQCKSKNELEKEVDILTNNTYALTDSIRQYQDKLGNIIAENIKKRFLRIKRRDFTNDFLKVIEMVKPDIIHIHGTENTFHTILGKVNIPVVISIQGNPSVYSYKFRSGFWGMFEKEKHDK